MTDEVRLDEYDYDEWYGVMKSIRPDMTDAEFDAAWQEFVQLKSDHIKKRNLH